MTRKAANQTSHTGQTEQNPFQTVRTYQADNIFDEVEDDPRIPHGWKPRLKEIVRLKAERRLTHADDRLPAAFDQLIRTRKVDQQQTQGQQISALPYLTMRCRVRTEQGEVQAHKLKPGDKVLTRDSGYQAITWVGVRKIFTAELGEGETMPIIHVAPGALAENTPESDIWVTPAQAFLMTPASHWQGIGVSEMLVRAADLTTLEGVTEEQVEKVGLVQLLLDSHEVIMVNGAWVGSLRPDPDRIEVMPEEHRDALCSRFPVLTDAVPSRPFASARVELKPQTALYLMNSRP